ncbi:unnamed protein product (mitochondrion) [Plasmodiophora brassicae]|uniref:Acyl-coenzyme A oxidase n=1 Tax=Plasmodiophora brassicae TaxID=37360 RepID=A0A0G4J5Q9_PLABS|nr:hypothetical protein PBRA_002829 [Plasmodiophora brassicae]SPQ94966.1 unnamed protein product [Plasmodiophora brassicae]
MEPVCKWAPLLIIGVAFIKGVVRGADMAQEMVESPASGTGPQHRIQKVLQHVSISDAADLGLSVPSIAQRLRPFIQVALPYKGIRIPQDLSFDSDAMQKLLDHSDHERRAQIVNFLATHPLFKKNRHYLAMPLDEQRSLVLAQLKAFVSSGLLDFHDYLKAPNRFIDAVGLLSFHGPNIATKCAVNFGLFGGTVIALGTEKHRKRYADRIAKLLVRGGFALTELGHGSNARGVETIATYDHTIKGFILHSPTETSQKFWIGNLACHCTHLVVFAQLYVKEVHHGVMVFIVRVRNDDGSVAEGVRIADCGIKAALNGIDNGRCWFDKKIVPRDALLDRYGTIDDNGNFVSDIKSNAGRFIVQIGALVYGRVVVSQAATHISKTALTIAIRYGITRRQFGPDSTSETEIPIMDYLSHQRRLFPLLAKTYALQLAVNHLKTISVNEPGSKTVHILAAGLKAVCTWHRSKTLQECREACGGMGFAACNRIGPMRNDSDIDCTWEGDNRVLLQQVSTALIKEFVEDGGMFAHLRRAMSMEIRDQPKRATITSGHLRSTDFFLHAFEYREARLLRALINKLNAKKDLGKFEAWNASLDLVQELALAHVDRVVAEQFVLHLESCPKSIKPMLSALCSLYCLCAIQDAMGWFLTFKYFAAMKAKAVWNEINRLCVALRPHARALVDAFGIPDELIDAPIAGDWASAYSYPKIPGEI